MTDARLPARVEEFLLDVATDHSVRDRRRLLLGFGGDTAMRDTFMEALASPKIDVHVDICEDEPSEVVVRACGSTATGTEWGTLNIMLLEPSWIGDSVSYDLAEDIVMHWDRLREIVAAEPRLAA